jgi:hypothetical protein
MCLAANISTTSTSIETHVSMCMCMCVCVCVCVCVAAVSFNNIHCTVQQGAEEISELDSESICMHASQEIMRICTWRIHIYTYRRINNALVVQEKER